jgi:hypothetical protein
LMLLSSAVSGSVDLLSLDMGSVSPSCMSPNSFVWRFFAASQSLYMMLKVKCRWIFLFCCTSNFVLFVDSEGKLQ